MATLMTDEQAALAVRIRMQGLAGTDVDPRATIDHSALRELLGMGLGELVAIGGIVERLFFLTCVDVAVLPPGEGEPEARRMAAIGALIAGEGAAEVLFRGLIAAAKSRT